MKKQKCSSINEYVSSPIHICSFFFAVQDYIRIVNIYKTKISNLAGYRLTRTNKIYYHFFFTKKTFFAHDPWIHSASFTSSQHFKLIIIGVIFVGICTL